MYILYIMFHIDLGGKESGLRGLVDFCHLPVYYKTERIEN
jgi:hypothetical protein